jgi:hypothetical protein
MGNSRRVEGTHQKVAIVDFLLMRVAVADRRHPFDFGIDAS